MPTFAINLLPQRPGQILWARFRSNTGATVIEGVMNETPVNPTYSLYSVSLVSTTSYASYTAEVRVVSAVNAAAFDASSNVALGPEGYTPAGDTYPTPSSTPTPTLSVVFPFAVTATVNGIPTPEDADTLPLLTDSGGTYGVKRADTGAVIVAALGDVVSRTGTGLYAYTLANAVPGVAYTASFKVTVNGAVGYKTSTVTASAGFPLSLYFTWQQFVNRFGLTNIVKASNKDTTQQGPTSVQPIPSGQPNWYAVQDAFNYATDKIHSVLMGGILKIPLDFTNNSGVVPPRVARWAMIIAFCDLLNMRNPDKIPAYAKGKIHSAMATYSSELDDALSELAMHKEGQYRQMLEAVHVTDTDAGIVSYGDVRASRGGVRYVGGQFTFAWGDVIL